MAALVTIKNVVLAILLACAFSSFILAIIDTNLQIVYGPGYPPAVVAWLVIACVQFLYILFQFATSMRGKKNAVSVVFLIHLAVTLYYLAIAITISVKLYTYHYCPAGPIRDASTCKGITQAILALAWIDFGLNSIYLGLLALAAMKFGGFSVPEGNLMSAEELETREVREKGMH